MRAAQIHAEQMARAGQLAHSSAERGLSASQIDRLAAARLSLADLRRERGAGPVERAARCCKSWMHSPGHRTNILKPGLHGDGRRLTRLDRAGRPYYVQVFARPLS